MNNSNIVIKISMIIDYNLYSTYLSGLCSTYVHLLKALLSSEML